MMLALVLVVGGCGYLDIGLVPLPPSVLGTWGIDAAGFANLARSFWDSGVVGDICDSGDIGTW